LKFTRAQSLQERKEKKVTYAPTKLNDKI